MTDGKVKKSDYRKCPICKENGIIHDMVTHEKYPRRYLHKSCLESKMEEIKWQEKENEAREKMFQTLAEIYNVEYSNISPFSYAMFERLRNGTPVFSGKAFDRRYKEGFDYEVIEETLKACRESIEYANKTKNFQSLTQSISYGMRIIVDRIPMISKRVERQRKADEVEKLRAENEKIDHDRIKATEVDSPIPRKRKRKKNENDISKFL